MAETRGEAVEGGLKGGGTGGAARNRMPTQENSTLLRWRRAAAVAPGGRITLWTWSNWSTRTGGSSTKPTTV